MSKTKIIALSVSVFIVLAIISLVITGFCTKKDFSVCLAKPDTIKVENLKGTVFTANESDLNKDTIWNKFTESSKQTYIISLFSGTINSSANITKSTTKTVGNTGGFAIIFKYDEEQTLKFKDYNYVDETNTSITELKYTNLIFEAKEDQGLEYVDIHIMDLNDSSKYHYTISQYCSLNALYDYLYNIPNFANGENN